MAENPSKQIEKALRPRSQPSPIKFQEALRASSMADQMFTPSVKDAIAQIARPTADLNRMTTAFPPGMFESVGEQIKALVTRPTLEGVFPDVAKQIRDSTKPSIENLFPKVAEQIKMSTAPKFDGLFPKVAAMQAISKPVVSEDLLAQITRQQLQFDQIFKGTEISRALAGWQASLPTTFTDQALGYDGVVEEVGAEEVLEDIAARRQEVLAALREICEALTAAKLLGVVEIPDVVLGLLMVFILYGNKADSIISGRSADD